MSTRLRSAAGRAYAALWRALDGLLARGAPASVRAQRALPVLPGTPVHRRYGLRVGRPVDRFYIERFLAAHAEDIHGRTLEVLDATYTRRFGGAAVTQADALE